MAENAGDGLVCFNLCRVPRKLGFEVRSIPHDAVDRAGPKYTDLVAQESSKGGRMIFRHSKILVHVKRDDAFPGDARLLAQGVKE